LLDLGGDVAVYFMQWISTKKSSAIKAVGKRGNKNKGTPSNIS
jgi:hypothetical protein